MSQEIKQRSSVVPGAKPTTGNLLVRELGINVYDGKVFLHRSGSTQSIEEIIVTGANNTGSIFLSGSMTLTGSLNVLGSVNSNSFTGSLLGTASYSNQSLSSSYALTASYIAGGGVSDVNGLSGSVSLGLSEILAAGNSSTITPIIRTVAFSNPTTLNLLSLRAFNTSGSSKIQELQNKAGTIALIDDVIAMSMIL